jgi:uncharacterized protein (DUF1501 family)
MSRNRREFLKTTLGVSTLLALGPGVPTILGRTRAQAANRSVSDNKILVMVQLGGGNDGLNTVIPYEDDEYGRNRPTIRFKANEVHKIDSQLGFHPQAKGLWRLYQEGHLGIVQGVGYPNPNGDHAASMRIWQTASIDYQGCQTGWLGRAIDRASDADTADIPGVFVGTIARPFLLNAEETVVPSVRTLQDYTLQKQSAATAVPRSRNDRLVDFLQKASLQADAAADQLDAVLKKQKSGNRAEYPNVPGARRLRTVADLIRADLGIRMFCTDVGGGDTGAFDNHANQRGNHGALLNQLSESVAAFVDDLARDNLLDRVLLMTFSEFGRTVKENGRRGTGHGSAAPMFVVGGKVRGGLTGDHPSLTELESGGPKHHTDFRRLYATALQTWLGIDSGPVLGEDFKPLDFLEG